MTLFLDVRSLFIGKIYNAESLAYFNRGKVFASTVMTSINGTLQNVLFPTYTKLQNDKYELKQMLRKSIALSCFVIFPM